MKNIAFAALVLALSLPAAAALAGSPAPAVSPAATASASATPAARAKEWLHRLQTGAIDRTQLTDKMSAVLTDAEVKTLSDKVGPLGDPTDMKLVKTKPYADGTVYIFVVTFPNDTTLTYVFAIETASGKISGLSLSQAQ